MGAAGSLRNISSYKAALRAKNSRKKSGNTPFGKCFFNLCRNEAFWRVGSYIRTYCCNFYKKPYIFRMKAQTNVRYTAVSRETVFKRA